MGISRVLWSFFNSKIDGYISNDKIEKVEKAFHEILAEEHAKLMQLVVESQKNGTPVQLYQKYNPRMSDNLYYHE